MADRTFTLDWRIRTRKHETLMRAKLGALDTQLSFRKRVRGPVRLDPSMLVPSAPISTRELEPEIELDSGVREIGGVAGIGEVAPPTLRRASG